MAIRDDDIDQNVAEPTDRWVWDSKNILIDRLKRSVLTRNNDAVRARASNEFRMTSATNGKRQIDNLKEKKNTF